MEKNLRKPKLAYCVVVGIVLSSLLFPPAVEAKLANQPRPDVFGGGSIRLLYRVLDAHPEVEKSVGVPLNESIFLAKGSGSAVYLIRGRVVNKLIVGERHVFLTQQIYNTWFPDFKEVRSFRDDAIANTITHGPMLPAPGTLVKQPEGARVFVTTLGRLLRPLENEAVAATMFGSRWNQQIFDLDEFTFFQYQMGPAVNAATRLTELDVPPLPTDAERLRVARFEVAARVNRLLDQHLRDLYRQILAKRYLDILITWKRETGSFPPTPHPTDPGARAVRLGAVLNDGTVAALTEHTEFVGAIQYVPESQCDKKACLAFVPDAQEAPCGVGASPYIYTSDGKTFALDFCVESPEIITLPEVALEIHQRDMPVLTRGWYRFTEAGLRELP